MSLMSKEFFQPHASNFTLTCRESYSLDENISCRVCGRWVILAISCELPRQRIVVADKCTQRRRVRKAGFEQRIRFNIQTSKVRGGAVYTVFQATNIHACSAATVNYDPSAPTRIEISPAECIRQSPRQPSIQTPPAEKFLSVKSRKVRLSDVILILF